MPPTRKTLIVGAGARGRELARAILARPDLGYRIIGFVEDQPGLAGWDGIPILGATRDIVRLVERNAVEEILIAHAANGGDPLVADLVAAGRDEQVRRGLSTGGVGAAPRGRPHDGRAHGRAPTLREIAGIPLVAVNRPKPGAAYRAAKRCFDIGFSLAALIIAAPLIALTAALIRLTSAGPAFFCQRRVGLRGEEFTIYKLRTMVVDAERDTGPTLADPYDARVTPVGRVLRVTRLDEAPQFFNVLRGDMSVVGPRPERPEFATGFLAQVPGYAKRLAVRPGITGLAQVHGGYDTDVYTKLKYDWAYIYRQSLLLDLNILLRTVRVVLSCAGQ